MPQFHNNWVSARDMVRSRAWRHGYEDFRLGAPLVFSGHRSKALAYEYGRLTAAYLQSCGQQLIRISTTRPISEVYVPDLAKALEQCARIGAADWENPDTQGVSRASLARRAPGSVSSAAQLNKGRYRLLSDR